MRRLVKVLLVLLVVVAVSQTPFAYRRYQLGRLDATIRQFEDGVREDRIAFLDAFMANFFAAGDRHDLISEPSRLYHREIAEFASPKGTLDCIAAFSYTDFRDDIAKIDVPTLVIHGDSDAIVPLEVSGRRSHEALARGARRQLSGGDRRRAARLQRHPRRAVQWRPARLPRVAIGRRFRTERAPFRRFSAVLGNVHKEYSSRVLNQFGL